MTKLKSELFKASTGCGILCAVVAGAFGVTEGQQWIAFAFGATWGGIWISHE